MKLIVSYLGLMLLILTTPKVVFAEENLAEEKTQLDVPRLCRDNLASEINKIINRPQLRRSHWGIEIQTLEEGKTLYSLNGDQFFTPASSLKLLTSAAVLLELGSDYRIKTPLYSVGDGPNLSSLRFQGQGDPTVSTESLKTIVHQLQQKGIKKIENLIIDDSYFAPPLINPTWEWLDVHSYFATAVNSTILNQNTVTLTLFPQEIGQPVKYTWSDAIAARQWQVINQTTTGKADIDYGIELDSYLGQPILQLRGELGVNEPADVWDLAVLNPAQYFLESWRSQLTKAGISVIRGEVINQPESNPEEQELLTINAPPMQQLLTVINQSSNNLYAEVLGKILAKELNQETATDAIEYSLTNLGIKPNTYKLVDASGLSRQNLITPQTLVNTLRLMSQLPQGKSYQESLAVAGVSGTLKNRYANSSIIGNLFGKTGTLTGVSTLSGYIFDHQNSTLIFSIIVNNSDLKSKSIRQVIDQITVITNRLNKC